MTGSELTPVPRPGTPVPLPPAARAWRAARSPSGLVLAGAGAAVCVLAGAPPAVVVIVAMVCWLCRIAIGMALSRAPRAERILPYTLAEPWRQFVLTSVTLGQRFSTVAGQCPPGPLRDQLLMLRQRIEEGVWRAWDVAKKGQALDQALAALDAPRASRQATELRQHLERISTLEGPGAPDRPEVERTLAALDAQLTTAARLRKVSADTADRLRLLNAQLGEAVAQAVEVSLTEPSVVDLSQLAGSIDGAVDELEALRQGLDEAGRAAGGLSGPTA